MASHLPPFRIGQGYDSHRFGPGDHITLCGVRIPSPAGGIVAHSDGDVALHALCDALLGAAAQADLGTHFPDTDPSFQGVSSRDLLRRVVGIVRETASLTPVNADVTVVAETPRLAAHVAAMRETVAADLGIGVGRVSVKVKSNEGMGFVGRKEGLAAMAVVLVTEL